MSIQNFLSLLGKTLDISSKNDAQFFRNKSLIKVFNEIESDTNNNMSVSSENLGLPVLTEGLNCFSVNIKDNDNIFYLSIESSSFDQSLLEVHLYLISSSILNNPRIDFYDHIIALFHDQSFENFPENEISKFSHYFGIIPANKFNLTGQSISIKFNIEDEFASCHLGRKNPFYSDHEIILMWADTNSFYEAIPTGKNSKPSNFLLILMFLMFIAFLTGLYVCYIKRETIRKKLFGENKNETQNETI